jgi:hypothetical protein
LKVTWSIWFGLFRFLDRSFVLFLDRAYALGQATITPYAGRGAQLTAGEREFNRWISAKYQHFSSQAHVPVARVCGAVYRWGGNHGTDFNATTGVIKRLWTSLDDRGRMRSLLTPVSLLW